MTDERTTLSSTSHPVLVSLRRNHTTDTVFGGVRAPVCSARRDVEALPFDDHSTGFSFSSALPFDDYSTVFHCLCSGTFPRVGPRRHQPCFPCVPQVTTSSSVSPPPPPPRGTRWTSAGKTPSLEFVRIVGVSAPASRSLSGCQTPATLLYCILEVKIWLDQGHIPRSWPGYPGIREKRGRDDEEAPDPSPCHLSFACCLCVCACASLFCTKGPGWKRPMQHSQHRGQVFLVVFLPQQGTCQCQKDSRQRLGQQNSTSSSGCGVAFVLPGFGAQTTALSFFYPHSQACA